MTKKRDKPLHLDMSFDDQARMDALLRSPEVARDLKDVGSEDKE